jgi:hypothetical protein
MDVALCARPCAFSPTSIITKLSWLSTSASLQSRVDGGFGEERLNLIKKSSTRTSWCDNVCIGMVKNRELLTHNFPYF